MVYGILTIAGYAALEAPTLLPKHYWTTLVLHYRNGDAYEFHLRPATHSANRWKENPSGRTAADYRGSRGNNCQRQLSNASPQGRIHLQNARRNGSRSSALDSGRSSAAPAAHSVEEDVFAEDKLYAIRINDEFTVDVMPSVAGLSWEEMRSHITTTKIDDVTIRLLDLPGLLKTKQGVRPKDQMDAAVIAAALKRGEKK